MYRTGTDLVGFAKDSRKFENLSMNSLVGDGIAAILLSGVQVTDFEPKLMHLITLSITSCCLMGTIKLISAKPHL